jgi:predicted ATP-grasp superfamily ATP-dependent carboligase
MNPTPFKLLEYVGEWLPITSRVRVLPTTIPTTTPKKTPKKTPKPSQEEDEPLLVLVLEGEYRLTGAVLFCLSQQPGTTVHLLTRDADSPYQYSRYVRTCHVFDPGLPEADFVTFAQDVAQATLAEVFLPIDVAGMRFTIANRLALESVLPVLPLPTALNYEIAADKGRLAAFMRYHGIPAPDTIVDIYHNLEQKLQRFRFPVLLKPIDGAGGRGITRYQTPAAVLRAVAELPAGSRYIIQNCLEGYDIDCNVLYQNGKLVAHSIQKGMMPASDEYAPTEAIEFVRDAAVLAVVEPLMQALRWNGVAHLDLRYDARQQQINVIEINTRFWLTVVGSAVTAKVNFPWLACRAAAGLPVVQGPFALGRYIPFPNFCRHRFNWRARARSGIHFAWRDTSLRAFIGDPLAKLYRFMTDTK